MLTYWLIALIALLYGFGSGYPVLAGNLLADQLRRHYGPFSKLDVKVVTAPPIRAMSGQVDSLNVQAEGFFVAGIPVSTASLVTAPFFIPARPFWAPPKLPELVEGTASAVLSESDLNAILHSQDVILKLKGIQIQLSLMPGFSTTRTLNINPGRLRVLANQLTVDGTADMGDGAVFPFTMAATPRLVAPNRVGFENLQATLAGAAIPPSYLGSALQQAQFDLAPYQRVGKNFNLQRLVLAPGAISLEAVLKITDFR